MLQEQDRFIYRPVRLHNRSSTELPGLTYLSREQSVGIELLQPQHQVILGVDDIFHKEAIECKPIRATRDLQALWNAALPETPHVVVTLVEETIKALLLNKPSMRDRVQVNVWRITPLKINNHTEYYCLSCRHTFQIMLRESLCCRLPPSWHKQQNLKCFISFLWLTHVCPSVIHYSHLLWEGMAVGYSWIAKYHIFILLTGHFLSRGTWGSSCLFAATEMQSAHRWSCRRITTHVKTGRLKQNFIKCCLSSPSL